MENPETFDIFAGVLKEKRPMEIDWIIHNMGLSKSDAVRQWLTSAKNDAPILIGTGLGWNKAIATSVNASKYFQSVSIYVNSLGPKTDVLMCSAHNLYFSVTSVCPVCAEWYLDQDENGVYIKPKNGGRA